MYCTCMAQRRPFQWPENEVPNEGVIVSKPLAVRQLCNDISNAFCADNPRLTSGMRRLRGSG